MNMAAQIICGSLQLWPCYGLRCDSMYSVPYSNEKCNVIYQTNYDCTCWLHGTQKNFTVFIPLCYY